MSKSLIVLRTVIIATLLLFLGGTVGFRLGRGDAIPFVSSAISAIPSSRINNAAVPTTYRDVDFSQFWDVWGRLEQSYYDGGKLDAQKMLDGAISGMTASLGDPYTLYLPKTEQKRTSDDLNGSFDGVGIQLGYKNSTLVVVAPLKGLPAEKAGVVAGDYILKIVDKKKNVERETTGITLPDATSLIRGEKGTEVTLTFMREGGQPFEKTLVRDTIVIPTVELSTIDRDGKKIAHIKLSQFGGRTEDEWTKTVDEIVNAKQPYAGVILDLRNNPGGYLQEAVNIASEFIDAGPIVKQKGKTQEISYTVTRKGRLTKMPVVVLINKGSASASEIVAGALRDRRNAKLVGENSFGKGTVQDAQELPSGAGVHITVAKWLLPNGDWIHEKGIKPTVEVVVKPEDVEKLLTEGKDPQLDSALLQF